MAGIVAAACAMLWGGAPIAAGAPAAAPGSDSHHYRLNVRVRPLLLFWIGRSNVGDAVITRSVTPSSARYSLLIGSDPARAPRRINRWGYLEENIRGGEATVVGLMTESEEESVADAEASFRMGGSGTHTFKVIHASVDRQQSHSVVAAIGATTDYSLHQAQEVLDLARADNTAGKSRVVQLPAGTRPGFLSALAELVHAQAERARGGRDGAAETLTYVYHGKLFELRGSSVRVRPTFELGASRYGRVAVADFAMRSLADGEETSFSITYALDGALAEVPLTMSYQPRWWMQITLVLADQDTTPLTAGTQP
jgi:hypothetical protein